MLWDTHICVKLLANVEMIATMLKWPHTNLVRYVAVDRAEKVKRKL